MTVFSMFFIELMAARFDVFGEHGHDMATSDPALDLIRQSTYKDEEGKDNVETELRNSKQSFSISEEYHLSNHR
jgi:hypothetical protein